MMNSAGKEIAEAIEREVAEWPGVTVTIDNQAGKHPKAKLKFDGLIQAVPFSGSPGTQSARPAAVASVRRALRTMGAERSRPEPSVEDEAKEYQKPNEGRRKRPDPVAREIVVQTPDLVDQLEQAVEANVIPAPEPEPAGPDVNTLEGRNILAEADGWLGPGEHDIDAERYHLDPVKGFSLSASLSKRIIDLSPLHAWSDHPRLNPEFEPKDAHQFRMGRAFHTEMLGKGNPIEVFGFKDWRKKEAQECRDDSLARGCTPLLEEQYALIQAGVRAARHQMKMREELALAMQGGVPERVLIWEEETPHGVVTCRMMTDWTPHFGRYAVDWKWTGVDAGPDAWGQKAMWDQGCDIQDAFYRRGWRKVMGRDFDAIIFAVVENTAPHCMMHHRVDPMAQEEADWAVQKAINTWAWCLKHNRWPGYPTQMAWQSKPGWRANMAEARRASGMLDTDRLDAYLENLREIAALPRPGGGVEQSAENPFGLSEIDE